MSLWELVPDGFLTTCSCSIFIFVKSNCVHGATSFKNSYSLINSIKSYFDKITNTHPSFQALSLMNECHQRHAPT
jgi:hypothetical protein